MDRFVHPDPSDVTLTAVLHALSDPARRRILRALVADAGAGGCGLACAAAAPPNLPRATMSNHYSVLRAAGLVRAERRGVEVIHTPRCAEMEQRFPGVVRAILTAESDAAKS